MEIKLLNELAARGCNIEEMLNDTYMGREDFYEKMLRRFHESTAVQRLRTAFEAGDVKGCFEASHEFKGLTSTLGLAPVCRVCCEIVERVRPLVSLDGVGERLSELERLRDEFVSVIDGN